MHACASCETEAMEVGYPCYCILGSGELTKRHIRYVQVFHPNIHLQLQIQNLNLFACMREQSVAAHEQLYVG